MTDKIEIVKVDPGLEFCTCCHVFGCEQLVKIPVILPGQMRYAYLCDECCETIGRLGGTLNGEN